MGKKVKKKKPSTERRPHEVTDLFETAYSYHVKGDYPKAEETYKQIIRLEPRHSNALNLLGTICLERGEYDNALDLIRKAVKAYPMGAMFHNNLGNVFRKMGMVQDAEKAYREALRVAPDNVAANNNLGIVLHEQGNMEGAIGYYEKAHRYDPGFSPAFYNLGRVFCEQGRIETSIWAYREALKINPGFHDAYSNLLYTLHFSDTVTPEQIFDEHRIWAKTFAETYCPAKPVYANNTDKERRLKIGYVSPDFRTHSVAFFFENVISYHDRNQVEVFCYSSTEKPDDLTRHFRELADGWRDISCLSDDEAASIIKKDQIDILIDLAGHTGGSRILIFARKPAPVQVTWLGYPDTTGLDTMDYRLTDAIADPPGLTDHLSTEKLVRLDGGFLCYRPSGESYPISPSPFIAAGAVTFGSFNNNSKISESVISAWSQIMKKTPGSRLKLKSRSFADFGTRRYILERFDHYGIPAERIWFEGYKVSMKEHFLLYGTVDIALDTFPYNGTTTTCEAIWMGVPVIALRGKAHASRVGSSLLHQVGLDELIAFSEEEYVEKAVNLALDRDRLFDLRVSLRPRMKKSPLMAPAGFCRKLETAYRAMWANQDNRGEPKRVEQKKDEVAEVESQDLYKKNLEIVRAFHPDVESVLDLKHPFVMDVRISPSGVSNLFIGQEESSLSPLYSEQNPLCDVEPLVKQGKNLNGKVICIMGSGLFIHALPLVKAMGAVNLMVFFEAVPALFRKAMETVDLSDILSNPHVRLAVGDKADPYELLNQDDDNLFSSNGGVFIEFPQIMELSPAWYGDKKKQWESFLSRRMVSKVTSAFAGKRFFTNSLRNVMALAEAEPVSALCNRFKGLPAIIVATGPSLSKNIGLISGYKDKALIIAADSAVAPLAFHGICPHIVVSVDYNDFTYEKLAPFAENLQNTLLIHLPSITPKILNYIDFAKRYYAYPDQGFLNFFTMILGKESEALEDIQSVIHLALKTAQVGGCDPIIFTGLDLAYDGSRDHAAGTLLHWDNNHTSAPEDVLVEGALGGMVLSRREFVGMIEILGRMMARVPERRYIDATEGGAKKEGALVMGLKQAGETWLCETIVLPKIEERKPRQRLWPKLVESIERIRNDAEHSLKQIWDYEKELGILESFIKKRGHDRGLPSELNPNARASVRAMDRINGLLDKNSLLISLNSLFVESFDEYLAFELEARKSKEGSDPSLRFMTGLKQQAFVQRTRKNVLILLLEILDVEREKIKKLLFLEQKIEGQPESQDLKSELARWYYDNDLLAKATGCFKNLPHKPEARLYLGFISVLTGFVEKGRGLIEQAVEQEQGMKDKAETFIFSMVDRYLLEDGPRSFKDIGINKAMTLSPENKAVAAARQKRLLEKAEKHISDNHNLDALNELHKEKGWHAFDDEILLALFAFLLFDHDEVALGISCLKKSVETQFICAERESLLKRTIKDGLRLKAFDPDSGWGKKLVEQAREERWAKRAIQEFWNMEMGDILSLVFKKNLCQRDKERLTCLVETWSPLKEILPEWSLSNALLHLTEGYEIEAINWMDRALSMEEQGVSGYYGDGFLLYLKGAFHVFAGDLASGLPLICEGEERLHRPGIKMMAALLMLRMGKDSEASLMIEKMAGDKGLPSIEERMVQAFIKGHLKEELHSLEGLKYLSAYFAVMGKYHLETGHEKGGLDCFRASVSLDPEGASSVPWIMDHVQRAWEEDLRVCENLLQQNDLMSAVDRVESWTNAKTTIPDFEVVMSHIIEKKDGMVKALEYLMDKSEEQENNPLFLSHCARLLFDAGYTEDARLMLEKAVSIDSVFAVTWEDMGDAYADMSENAEALASYEKCLNALPERIDVLRKIGDVYRRMGNRESAAMAYESVLQLQPGHVLALRGLDEVRNGS